MILSHLSLEQTHREEKVTVFTENWNLQSDTVLRNYELRPVAPSAIVMPWWQAFDGKHLLVGARPSSALHEQEPTDDLDGHSLIYILFVLNSRDGTHVTPFTQTFLADTNKKTTRELSFKRRLDNNRANLKSQ